MANQFLTFPYFLLLGFLSLFLLTSSITLSAIIQILTVLAAVIIILAKLILPKIAPGFKRLTLILTVSPLILFIYLLTLATGGPSSPFLILTHLFTIGTAFLISPQVAIAYIAANIILLTASLVVDPTAQALARETPLAVLLYFVAYLALVPLSYLLARGYHLKEEWAVLLEKQIATSKTQEEILLKNITDPLLVTDTQFNLVYLNQAATKLTGYGQEILGQDFFKIFSFKDDKGRDLASYSLPFDQTLSSKMQSTVENIKIKTKDKKYLKVDLKLLPAIGPKGPVGEIIIVYEQETKEEAKTRKENTAQIALARFLLFLNSQKTAFLDLEKHFGQNEQLKNLKNLNHELEHLAGDFIYAQRLELGDIGALSQLLDLGTLVKDTIAEEESHAKDLGLILMAKTHSQKEHLLQPKSQKRFTLPERLFPIVYVLGNFIWIKDSLKRILEIIFLLTPRSQTVEIEVSSKEGLGQVQIITSINHITADAAPQLFEKFYGKLGHLPRLSESSGLEGYIAASLIERMGGAITIESPKNKPGLVFKITFGLK